MALAKNLIPGTDVVVTSGGYEGQTATIVDNVPVPDGQENQRKILVDLHDDDGQTFRCYMLPRLLADPTEMARAAALTTFQIPDQNGDLVTLQADDITDPMDPALDRFRPNRSVVDRYVSRTLPGGFTDVEYLLHLRDQRDDNGYSPNVALVGETQSGKTMLVQVLAVLAAERDGLPKPYPVFTLSGSSGVTSYDIFGQTTAVILNGKETLVWLEGLAAMAAKAGGFLYLDEWNAVPPSQAVAVHPLLDDRRQFINTQKALPDGHGGFAPEVVKASTDLWVLSTINPGYKGTQTMAEATSNRFRWLPWDYDDETERTLIPSKTVRLIGGRLREAYAIRIATVPVGTSVLQRLNDDCATFGVETAMWSFYALFPPAERQRIRTVVEDGGMLDLLNQEFPTPVLTPTGAAAKEDVKLGNTWQV